jgi:hypothetical protein
MSRREIRGVRMWDSKRGPARSRREGVVVEVVTLRETASRDLRVAGGVLLVELGYVQRGVDTWLRKLNVATEQVL